MDSLRYCETGIVRFDMNNGAHRTGRIPQKRPPTRLLDKHSEC